MLSQDHFYWEMTKKYVVAFSHIFSDIHVVRTDSGGLDVKDITVPVTYAGKRKMYQVLQRNSTINGKVSTVLPRISFLITGLTPDPQRKCNPTNQISISSDATTEEFMYNPVPYNFNIDLVVWAKNMDDLLQVIEQSATFFNPHYTLTVNEIEELNIQRNITVTLNSTDLEIDGEYDEESERTLMATMNFTLKGFLYKPITESAIIALINAKLVDEDDNAISNIELDWDYLTDITTETRTYGKEAEWPD